MIGTYVSNAEEPIAEIPSRGTKLFIHNDGKYTSSSSAMGKGIYRIVGSEIYLTNEEENSGWALPLCREYNIGKPKILLFKDLAYYMIKE